MEEQYNELQAQRDTLLAACKTALDLLVELNQYDRLYCEICERYAPKDCETGELIGTLAHLDFCPIGEIEQAIFMAS